MLDYEAAAEEYAKGVDWQSWPQAKDRDVLEMRLIALRHKEAKCQQEAQRLHIEGENLSQLLVAM